MKLLSEISKAEIVDFFNTRVHHTAPERAKFSIHLRSKKPRSQRVSEAALAAFAQELVDQGKTTTDAVAGWKEELLGSGEPELRHASEYWTRALLQAGTPEDKTATEATLRRLEELARVHPAQSDYEGTLSEGSKLIEDYKAYKSTLRVSDSPRPVVEWNDLPTAKF